MLVLLLWVVLFAWSYRLAKRQRALAALAEHGRADPPASEALAADREAWTRARGFAGRALIVVAGAWVLLFALYQGATSDLASARELRAECTERLEGAALQACLSEPHAAELDALGDVARLEVLVWVIGAL